MTKQHPITPPPELVTRLWREANEGRLDLNHPSPIGEIFNHGVYHAYAAGADHQLSVCCKALDDIPGGWGDSRHLRHVCRPKPPSLAEQATAKLDDAVMRGDCITTTDAMPLLRAVIKRLSELEAKE